MADRRPAGLDTRWRDQAVSPSDAVRHVKSGDRVFVHGAAAVWVERTSTR